MNDNTITLFLSGLLSLIFISLSTSSFFLPPVPITQILGGHFYRKTFNEQTLSRNLTFVIQGVMIA